MNANSNLPGSEMTAHDGRAIGCVQHDCALCAKANALLAETLEAFNALLLGRKMKKAQRLSLQARIAAHLDGRRP